MAAIHYFILFFDEEIKHALPKEFERVIFFFSKESVISNIKDCCQ